MDLQLSGHTHGGQIWPFQLIVRVEQGALQGLSRHGPRTQLYTTRGVGFWGPPFRVFAPSEISLLTLRSGQRGAAEPAPATTAPVGIDQVRCCEFAISCAVVATPAIRRNDSNRRLAVRLETCS